ncbi:rhodanese-like domain-containing protein [Campylobacter sp. JMF_01 NE2]|uniref:sulfurtransferase n=1 Tax=unclassified Campylobacter TaxID=2593542 RepID=UPI0022E9B839|nr:MULTISPECIES: rhodanese-like domain-containing protein [unclassified Campylobacter]MDA3052338.1 rhodanese-like domain-containing protein [Campylobacter sp. JMF_03 NE3]MDA3066672.1 rhodanese-like domain-containing protein [Campylobacter sp. JMF_01 NE2]
MKLLTSSLLAAACTCAFALDLPQNKVVDVEWLKANLADKDLVLIDLQEGEGYGAGHIKGAVAWKEADFREARGEMPGFIASPTTVERLFQKSGIKDTSAVVFYNDAKAAPDYTLSTLALFVSEYYGLTNTAILNGGIDAWKKAGGELSTEAVTPEKSDFKITKFNKDIVATAYDIDEAVVTNSVALIDGRIEAQYSGEKAHPKAAKGGHLEGVDGNIFIGKLAKENDGVFYINTDKEAVGELFKTAGLDPNAPQIWYCNTGWHASGGWFATKYIMGNDKVKNYEASMVEYSNLPKRKVLKGDEK